MSSFRVCPGNGTGTVGETRMEFDYYYDDGDGGMEGFEEYYKFVRRVAMEDFELCETAQKNLERGVYSQGVLNEVKESGVLRKSPIFTQTLVSFLLACCSFLRRRIRRRRPPLSFGIKISSILMIWGSPCRNKSLLRTFCSFLL